jgi:SHS2 domain-containing protein
VHEWIEHTAELELRLESPTREGIFAQALAALAELLDDQPAQPDVRRDVQLEASDGPALLAAWIDELVFLAETEGIVPRALAELELEPTTLRATVVGARGTPANLVKAATYHRLALEPAGAGWRATVVLDV